MNVLVLRKQTLHYMLQHNVFRPRDAIHDLSGLFWGVLNARLAQLATRSRAQGLCEEYCLSCVRSSAVSYRDERERRESAVLLTRIMRSFLYDHTMLPVFPQR